MKWLLVPCLLLALVVAPATASAFKVWCPADDVEGRQEQVFIVNEIGSASVLLVKGQPPNYLPRQEQTNVPVNPSDPLDLRAFPGWMVEGHPFTPCNVLPDWVTSVYLPSEVGIPRAASPE